MNDQLHYTQDVYRHSNSFDKVMEINLDRYDNTQTLTHWGRVTHICVGKLTIAEWRQSVSWTNAATLLIGRLEAYLSDISTEIQIFSSREMRLEMSSAKC